MASWKRAGRFAGDALLLGEEPGASFDLGLDGWLQLPSGERRTAAQVLSVVGVEQRDFIWGATAQAQLKSAQRLVDRSAALLLGRSSLAAVERCRAEVERISRELAEIEECP